MLHEAEIFTNEIASASTNRSIPGNMTEPVFIQNSSESNYYYSISSKIPIPAAAHMKKIVFLESQIYLISHFINFSYSKRSVAGPLLRYFETVRHEDENKFNELLKSEQTTAAGKKMLNPLISFFEQIQLNAQQLGVYFVNILNDDKFWDDALYSDIYLSKLSMLVYKIISIETVIQYKPGLIDDISKLSKFIKDTKFIMNFQNLRMWISAFNSNTRTIIEEIISKVSYARIFSFFNILFNFIQNQIVQQKYILSEEKYSYIAMLIFIVKLYYKAMEKEKRESEQSNKYKPIMVPLPLNVKIFIEDIVFTHKSIMIYCEIWPDLRQYFPNDIFNFTAKEKQSRKEQSLFGFGIEDIESTKDDIQILDDKRMSLFRASRIITKSIGKQILPEEQILTAVPNLCREVSTTVSLLAEMLEQRRSYLPPKPDNISNEQWKDNATKSKFQYDYAMTKGLSDIKKRLLLLIAACRTSLEVVQKNDISIISSIHKLTQEYIQSFVAEKIPILIQQTPQLSQIFNALKDILGSFVTETIQSDNPKLEGQTVTKNIIPKSSPHLMFLELARVQLQMIINPNSPYRTKQNIFSNTIIGEKSIQIIQKFIDDTYFFSDLLKLPELLSKTGDLSSLFFKEYWLDRCKVSFFRVNTSLPYILTNYALENYSQIKVIFAIFYPLSIYDDAAHFALNSLKSTLLYNEIKNEAQVCLACITRLIADLTFHPMLTFFATRSFHQSLLKELINEGFFPALYATSAAPRMNILLEPNQLFLLGCSVDVKTLIARRINELFDATLSQIETLIHQNGLLVMIAIKKIIDVLNITNKHLLSYGLPIQTFSQLFRYRFAMDNPDSLQNVIIVEISDYVNNVLFSEYYTLTTPFRIIPYVQPQISFMSIFKNQGASIMERILKPTCTTITLQHIQAYLEIVGINGANILFMQFLNLIKSYFDDFIESYKKMQSNFILMKDFSDKISCAQAFSKYFGAYGNYLSSPLIDEIFYDLSSIGNILALASLLDNAVLLFSLNSQLTSAYCFSIPVNKDEKPFYPDDSELFDCFDKEFGQCKQYFSTYFKLFSSNDEYNVYFTRCIEILVHLVQNTPILHESSSDLLNIKSLTSFAASWSILDFLFTLNEVSIKGKLDDSNNNTIRKWGESTYLTSAVIHLATRQIHLHDLLSINETIIYYDKVEFGNSKNSVLYEFLKVARFRRSSFRFAKEFAEPFVRKFVEI